MNMTKPIISKDFTGSTIEKGTILFGITQIKGRLLFLYGIMLCAVLAVFFNPSLQILTGPILAVCFTYLYFSGSKALVTSVIIVANDALGCIFFGKIAFPYLLLVLYLILLFLHKEYLKISLAQLISAFFLLTMIFTLIINGLASIKTIIYTLTFICTAGSCIRETEEKKYFFKGVAIVVFLICLHACITGGVQYYELNEYSTSFLRKGILGVGVGDSNMSSLLVNIGIACTLFDEEFRWYTKLVMIVCGLFALAITLSTSGLLGLFLIFGCFIVVKRESVPKKVWNILVALLVIFGIVGIYTNLPEAMHNITIDAYIDRMVEKVDFLKEREFAATTTNRSTIASGKLDYFWNQQGIFGILFGQNSLLVGDGYIPHNTYIDLLLQIGLIGTTISILYMIYRLYHEWRNKLENRLYIVLKVIFLYSFSNLSLTQGSLFALAYLCMVMI